MLHTALNLNFYETKRTRSIQRSTKSTFYLILMKSLLRSKIHEITTSFFKRTASVNLVSLILIATRNRKPMFYVKSLDNLRALQESKSSKRSKSPKIKSSKKIKFKRNVRSVKKTRFSSSRSKNRPVRKLKLTQRQRKITFRNRSKKRSKSPYSVSQKSGRIK
jgi:hypothetical protein